MDTAPPAARLCDRPGAPLEESAADTRAHPTGTLRFFLAAGLARRLQVGDSLRQERPFNFVLGESERFFIRHEGFGNTPETSKEVGSGRSQVAVCRQLWLALKRFESGEAGGGSRGETDRHRSVESDHR